MHVRFTEDLPSELVSHVKAGCGLAGERWLVELQGIIRLLEKRWSIDVGKPFAGIEYNFVAPATAKNGDPVVVKIAPPWDPVEIHCEAAYLRDRSGEGCVRLFDEALDCRAVLIERILPGKSFADHFAGREPDSLGPAIEALK